MPGAGAAFKELGAAQLLELGSFPCACGRVHSPGLEHVVMAPGALEALPELIRQAGGSRPFLLAGKASFQAAGEKTLDILERAGLSCSSHVYPRTPMAPDEAALGSALMHFDHHSDCVVALGSGVINDIGKLLARCTGRPYIIAATAPSMDGYASATSSMERDGLKVSLDSMAPFAIVADLEVLCQAPRETLWAGVGDMIAKYISLCEWQIAHLLVDEYHCPQVAELVSGAVERCVKAAPGLMQRRTEAVGAVMDGLIVAGIAMKYAGLSRPASGMEHYFSHIWDMRHLAFGASSHLHGIQCGVATVMCLQIYEQIKTIKPDRDLALSRAGAFSLPDHRRRLMSFIGPGAQAMIARDQAEGKYDLEKHRLRLERILACWPQILQILDGLPSYGSVRAMLEGMGAPACPQELGHSGEELRLSFIMTKDIRDKYIGSRLLWDLGALEDAAALL